MTDLPIEELARQVLRTRLEEPGWAHWDLGPTLTARALRHLLLDVGKALQAYAHERLGACLTFLSLSRFDQQTQTRPHRDGGPAASLLLLGYEPSSVPSRLFLLDYTRAAYERGQTPGEFLDCCNPAFPMGAELLRPYTTEVRAFRPEHHQLVVINNSMLPVREARRGMLGVLHHAEITPRPGQTRVINSVLMGDAGDNTLCLSGADVQAFVETGAACTL